jgi:hypothetical protein
MDDRQLARVAARLLRGGVAPRHVRRCLAELRAHRADLVAQLRQQGYGPDAAIAEADARLGQPDDLVAATLERPELRGWANRSPWGVFVVLPLIAFIAVGVGLIALVITGLEWLSPAAKAAADPTVWRVGGPALVVSVQWLLPLALYAGIVAIAWRSRTPPAWPVAGLLLVAVLTSVVNMDLVAPLQPGGQGQLTVGAGYPPREALRSVVMVGAALAAMAVAVLRDRAMQTADIDSH